MRLGRSGRATHEGLARTLVRAGSAIAREGVNTPDPRTLVDVVHAAEAVDDVLAVAIGDDLIALRGGTVDERTVTDAHILWHRCRGPAAGLSVADPGTLTFHKPPPISRGLPVHPSPAPPVIADLLGRRWRIADDPDLHRPISIVGGPDGALLHLDDGGLLLLAGDASRRADEAVEVNGIGALSRPHDEVTSLPSPIILRPA